jgi:hypothetical protein
MMEMKDLLSHAADRLWSGTRNNKEQNSRTCVSVVKWTHGETEGDGN